MEIYDVVTKLIGPIDPIGDSHFDRTRLKNLKELFKLVDVLIADIHHVSFNRDRQEASMHKAGKMAYDFLQNTKEEWLLEEEK